MIFYFKKKDSSYIKRIAHFEMYYFQSNIIMYINFTGNFSWAPQLSFVRPFSATIRTISVARLKTESPVYNNSLRCIILKCLHSIYNLYSEKTIQAYIYRRYYSFSWSF